MGNFETISLFVLVGIGLAAVNEYRWTVVKGRELAAQSKKIAEEFAKLRTYHYGDYGRVVVHEEHKPEQDKA